MITWLFFYEEGSSLTPLHTIKEPLFVPRIGEYVRFVQNNKRVKEIKYIYGETTNMIEVFIE